MTSTEAGSTAGRVDAAPELVFQPVVDLARGAVVGYEALARFGPWPSPGGPRRRFAEATRVGGAAALDAAVIRAALSMRSRLPADCFLAINVEPPSLLAPEVRDALVAAGDLAGIVIELTEHHPESTGTLLPVVERLRAEGALFALDDVGAGHAGLQKVLELRPEVLKVDRSLVAGVGRDGARRAMVEMLGAVADRVDAWVLAEGVERVDDLTCLQELGVPLAQGYLLGRPGPPWRGVEPAASATLATLATTAEPLLRLVERAPTVRLGPTDRAAAFADDAVEVTVVVDAADRPMGVITPGAAMTGDVKWALRVRTDTSPAALARRLSASSLDPTLPVLVTDRSGRYQGVVTLRRLLAHLGGEDRGTGAEA